MDDQWFVIDSAVRDDHGTISGYARADVSSPWFSGHFPGEPILPGIGQISLIFEVLKNHSLAGTAIQVSEVSRLRFRRIVRPGESMFFEIKPDPRRDDAYKFKITVNDELACNGNLVVAQ